MGEHSYIACDLGAGSGRVIIGRLREGKLSLDEMHRFVSPPVKIQGTLRLNILHIFDELKTGLRKVTASGVQPASLSVDSWGVDYVLFREGEPMLTLPYQYRDARTERVFEAAVRRAGAELIFAETGIQFMAINTLFQLAAELEQGREIMLLADGFLNIADYFNYLFSGVARAEQSLASTTQIYNPSTRAWSKTLIERFSFPERIFPKIVPSATRLGPLTPELQTETGLPEIEIIATCSHDTGAAVAAIPATGDDWAFLSSGTWSLIGVELPAPLINDEVRARNFTNEAGCGGTTRFLKNLVGLWIIQEMRRDWEREGRACDYATLDAEAGSAAPWRSLIHPSAARFSSPGQMAEKVAAYCRETGQPMPETPGQFARCVYESLALLYRATLDELQMLTGRPIQRLHIVGGGSQSGLFNQCVANATGREVIAGPVEATAIGNILLQAFALGQIESLAALRRVVRDSSALQTFAPRDAAQWQEAVARFSTLPPQ